MGSLADLYRFQAVAWMYSNATMHRYAVLRPGGDGISVDVVHFGHK
jgi:hypothetical protein